ncbi:phasin family protein [Nordella sp. HKS 07]|uniref:phasin family protein n=1 Tax=Nordella sp. HKS 07 TaxID=2712222 RepID=UPI0013E19789|nr:phasin family protein [Nordella sp. HKS 07]QIG51299.1 phasin family protein [Nordella sp. HKS 07]
MIKSFEDFQALGKDSVDAYVISATAVSKGFQTIAAEAVDFSRKSFERGTEAFEKASAAKSFDKALEVQQGYAKEAYEAFLGQMNKFGELYLATAKEAYKPFESKFAALTPKVTK